MNIGMVKCSPLLLYYIMVLQTDYRVEGIERNIDFWKYRLIEGIDAIVDLPQLGIPLLMGEIYEEVTLTVE